jgi:hypothetical protein
VKNPEIGKNGAFPPELAITAMMFKALPGAS